MMTARGTYHEPVLLHECIEALDIKADGTYVDVTFGGGGHSRAILEQLGPEGSLIAFDRDADARRNAPHDPRFTLVSSDYRWIRNHLRYLDKLPVDGLLADLGVSSHQFDTAGRGFSFRHDAPLDMRMNQRARRTAADIVNGADERTLTDLLRKYGEVGQPHKVARALVQVRAARPISTTGQLAEAVRPLARRGEENSFLAQVFQAFRIAVNDELGSLERLLEESAGVMRPGGRLVVMSYHSLEDRLVKNWMRAGNLEGEEHKDVYGNAVRPFKPMRAKAVQATEQEQAMNPRARSARLRTAIRL
jgi:16S rRNA (cytosine1402-N4)-methyltransferase